MMMRGLGAIWPVVIAIVTVTVIGRGNEAAAAAVVPAQSAVAVEAHPRALGVLVVAVIRPACHPGSGLVGTNCQGCCGCLGRVGGIAHEGVEAWVPARPREEHTHTYTVCISDRIIDSSQHTNKLMLQRERMHAGASTNKPPTLAVLLFLCLHMSLSPPLRRALFPPPARSATALLRPPLVSFPRTICRGAGWA